LALSEAKREALSLRAGGSGVDSLIARGRDVDSDFRTPFSDPWVEVLSRLERRVTHSWHGMFWFL
jgi:hypothetical protein